MYTHRAEFMVGKKSYVPRLPEQTVNYKHIWLTSYEDDYNFMVFIVTLPTSTLETTLIKKKLHVYIKIQNRNRKIA